MTDDQRRVEAEKQKVPLGSGNCWCGEPPFHDWPGKDEGKPHPR